jgi:hypothetical protein
MCMNCGCGLPDETHGKKENLTADVLRRAGRANRQSLRTTAQHILETVELMEGRAEAQSPAPGGPGPANQRRGAAGSAARTRSRRDRLATPAGRRGASRAPRGTPASES